MLCIAGISLLFSSTADPPNRSGPAFLGKVLDLLVGKFSCYTALTKICLPGLVILKASQSPHWISVLHVSSHLRLTSQPLLAAQEFPLWSQCPVRQLYFTLICLGPLYKVIIFHFRMGGNHHQGEGEDMSIMGMYMSPHDLYIVILMVILS